MNSLFIFILHISSIMMVCICGQKKFLCAGCFLSFSWNNEQMEEKTRKIFFPPLSRCVILEIWEKAKAKIAENRSWGNVRFNSSYCMYCSIGVCLFSNFDWFCVHWIGVGILFILVKTILEWNRGILCEFSSSVYSI